MSLTPSGLPQMREAGNPGVWAKEATTTGEVTFYTFTWNLGFSVQQDPDDKLVTMPATPSSMSMTCGNRNIEGIKGELSFDGSSRATLKIAQTIQDQDLERVKPVSCQVSGNVDVRLSSGAPFSLSFTASAYYPTRAEPAPPNPPVSQPVPPPAQP